MLRSPYFWMVQVTFGLLLLHVCDDNHGMLLLLLGCGCIVLSELVAVGFIAQLVSGIADVMGLNPVHSEFFSGLILHNCL